LLFFEFSGPCVNAVQLHVYDAADLVRRSVDGTASDNRLRSLCTALVADRRSTGSRSNGNSASQEQGLASATHPGRASIPGPTGSSTRAGVCTWQPCAARAAAQRDATPSAAHREQTNVYFDIAGLSPRLIPAEVIGSCGGGCTSSACGAAPCRSSPPSAARPGSMASACPRLSSTTCCAATPSASSGSAGDTPAKPG